MTVVSHYENHLVFVNVSCSGPYWTEIGLLTFYVQYIQDSTKSSTFKNCIEARESKNKTFKKRT